ncbi:MAG: arsenate reductase ArsC, partial [Candidatus Thermoplasmatota archaeon]|nr:arsenate reductase ArsC [Candidatus Thermoplasmatota archaeon]
VFSAGTEATEVNPFTLEVLKDLGIDTSSLHSKSLDIYLDQEFDEVVTVCDHAKEVCPFFPGAKIRTHQGFRDPPDLVEKGMEPLAAFRMVRDDIDRWIQDHFS